MKLDGKRWEMQRRGGGSVKGARQEVWKGGINFEERMETRRKGKRLGKSSGLDRRKNHGWNGECEGKE